MTPATVDAISTYGAKSFRKRNESLPLYTCTFQLLPYFGIERHLTEGGSEIEGSHCAVNNVYLNGVRVAVVAPNGDAQYYLTDQVDSVKFVVNDSGLPVKRIEYMPYGETWFEEGEQNHAPKYNSQELDKETGYYYYNARHYDPEIARFVTADNVIDGEGDTQGWNRYSYVKGNPIVYKDPTGHNAVTDFFEKVQNKYKTGEFVTNKTKAWGGKRGKEILNSFNKDSRLDTEKKVAEMEAKGLKIDKLQKKLTAIRIKGGCNRGMNKLEKALLNQYKTYDLTGKKDTMVVKPVANSAITSGYGGARPDHLAIDLGRVPGGNAGKPVVAAKGGVVLYTRYQAGRDGQAGGGLYAKVRNNDGTNSYYMHLQGKGVTKGDTLGAGDRIGSVGNSGSETMAVPMDEHLHYQEQDANGRARRPTEVENLY